MVLGKFLDDVFERKCLITTSYPNEVVQDIESSVRQLLWKIISKAKPLKIKVFVPGTDVDLSFGDLFPISDLIPVGSYYEGTRVGDPFEFDFMLPINAPNLDIVEGCGPGLVKIKRHSADLWKDVTDFEYTEANNVDSAFPSCTGIFDTTIMKLTNPDMNFLTEDDCVVKSRSGTLKCMRSGMLHMAFLWSPNSGEAGDQVISVDTMPAFPCPNHHIITTCQNKSFNGQFLDLVKKHKCYLIPKPCIRAGCVNCFHVTFATSENKLMRDMDPAHKRCYSLLKHLVSLKSEFEDNLTDVSSYKIKTCLLYHVYNDSHGVCKKHSISECTMDILKRITTCYQDMKMPKFFQRDSSLFDKFEYSCSVLDVLIEENSEIGNMISGRTTENERVKIMESANVGGWFGITKSVLLIFYEYLRSLELLCLRDYDFNKAYALFENVAHSLDQHLATSKELTVQRSELTNKMICTTDQLFLPLYYILTMSIPVILLENLEGIVCPQLPFQMLTSNQLKVEKDVALKSQIDNLSPCSSKFYVRMTSGYFSIVDAQKTIVKKSEADMLSCSAIVHHSFWQD